MTSIKSNEVIWNERFQLVLSKVDWRRLKLNKIKKNNPQEL